MAKVQQRRQYLGLDTRTCLLMLKGALPPTIVIAIYQTDVISYISQTVGYLAAIMTVTSQCLLPRAKFIEIMLFVLLSVSITAALSYLAVYSSVKARLNSLSPDTSSDIVNGYNSNASAVSAVWMIFSVWLANTFRAWKPQELQDPMVAASIFAVVSMTRSATFTTLDEGFSFVSMLLKTFMIGLAIGTGVSLFILPLTSREDVFRDIKAYVSQVESVLNLQVSFVESINSSGFWTSIRAFNRTETNRNRTQTNDAEHLDLLAQRNSNRRLLLVAIDRLNGIQKKYNSDLVSSRDEVAWGKLSANDLDGISSLMWNLLLPLSGMSMLPDILQKIEEHRTESNHPSNVHDRLETSTGPEDIPLEHSTTSQVAQTLYESISVCANLTNAGLQYALLAFELIKPKELDRQRTRQNLGPIKKDEESNGSALSPLQDGFPVHFQTAVQIHCSRRRRWDDFHNLEVFYKLEDIYADTQDFAMTTGGSQVRQEFFLTLHMSHLQDKLLHATSELVKFADSKIKDGTMRQSRLIFPKQESLQRWLCLKNNARTDDDSTSHLSSASKGTGIRGENAARHLDPEHLPPANAWQKLTNVLRVVWRFIASEQSSFGLRVAAASFCVAILAYLRQTQTFFTHQRLVWAMVIIVIGMSPTSGQSLFGFMARILATMVSVALSLMVWYTVDGKTAGVIVLLYLANALEYYYYIKKPQYFGACVIAIVTLNVIIGYELQVRKLGLEQAESNGQPYYPIYLFGPYKLLTVIVGCAISFFWIIFPYPITAKTKLRGLLGRSLFVLAEFYACMHTSIQVWMTGEYGDIQDPNSPAHILGAVRHRLFKEEMGLLNSLHMHARFTRYEPPIGGRFPKEIYDQIISEVQTILTSMSLMAHATESVDDLLPEKALSSATSSVSSSSDLPAVDRPSWIRNLAHLAKSADFNSHKVTSVLCNLSAAVSSSQPLPPYLSLPQQFPLARKLRETNETVMHIQNVQDPVFPAFVSLEVLSSMVSLSLRDLVSDVKKLVGEISFGFDVGHARSGESA